MFLFYSSLFASKSQTWSICYHLQKDYVPPSDILSIFVFLCVWSIDHIIV